jgi:hypothetical protein
MSTLKTNFEELVSKLQESGKVFTLKDEDKNAMLSGIKSDLENYRLEGQIKQQESLMEMKSLILTT